jgi:hypothetical protein
MALSEFVCDLYFSEHNPPKAERITVRQFNQYYHFTQVTPCLSEHTIRLRDPGYAFMSISTRALVYYHRYLSVKDLKSLVYTHSITGAKATIEGMSARLSEHQCAGICPMLYTVFKISTRPRNNIENRFIGRVVAMTVEAHSSQLPDEDNNLRKALADWTKGTETASRAAYDHLSVPDKGTLLSIVEKWEQEMSVKRLERVTCAACAKLSFTDVMSSVAPEELDLRLLGNPGLPESVRPVGYDYELYRKAILHPKGMTERYKLGPLQLCLTCRTDLSHSRMPKFALCNWLYYGRDCLPPAVKQAFDQSTQFERAMICRARTNILCC